MNDDKKTEKTKTSFLEYALTTVAICGVLGTAPGFKDMYVNQIKPAIENICATDLSSHQILLKKIDVKKYTQPFILKYKK